MTRLLLSLKAIPEVITDSVRCCLKAHGLSLSEEILIELGRNAAQSLTSIDESDARCSCGWIGSIDDIDGHTCALDSAMEGRDEPDPRVVLEGPPEASR